MRCVAWLLIVVALVFHPRGSWGQDLDPRAYANTPVGLNFAIAGYSYTTGSVTADPSTAIENAEVDYHGPLLAYARSIDLFGRSAKVDGVLSGGCVSGSALFQGMPRSRDVCGLADPRMRMSVNLFGAPALTLEEFPAYRQDLIVGASLQITAPLGQYESDKLLNLGTNRWTFKPELGVSKRIGALTLEVSAAVSVYTDNNDFLGGQHVERDPLLASQFHAIYSLRSGIWGSLSATYYSGGRSSVDGIRKDDRQENTRIGAAVAIPLTRAHALKLFANSGTTSRTDTNFDTIGLALQYRWGGSA